MSDTDQSQPEPERQSEPTAWQPFTFAGTAAFAGASFARVWLLWTVTALLASLVLLWFLNRQVVPVLTVAAQSFPDTAILHKGVLRGVETVPLAANSFLSLAVARGDETPVTHTSDLQVEFREMSVRFCSLAGCRHARYPAWTLALDRATAEPWWGAWKPPILVGVVIASSALLLLSWCLLATLYAPIAWMIGYFTDRSLAWGGAWRLAAAALVPGACLMTLGIALYAVRWLDLPRALLAFALHFPVAWVYLAAAPAWLDRAEAKSPPNPFSPAGPARPKNPFR